MNNRMAGEIFITATTVHLGLDIHINSAQCNQTMQSQPVKIIKRISGNLSTYFEVSDVSFLLIFSMFAIPHRTNEIGSSSAAF